MEGKIITLGPSASGSSLGPDRAVARRRRRKGTVGAEVEGSRAVPPSAEQEDCEKQEACRARRWSDESEQRDGPDSLSSLVLLYKVGSLGAALARFALSAPCGATAAMLISFFSDDLR